MADQADAVQTWFKRIDRAKKVKKKWEEDYEVGRCKDYWKGHQLDEPNDEFGQRRVQINRIHPTVRTSIPALYFRSPFVRITASPALAATPGQTPGRSIDDKVRLLQDTGNTFIRLPSANFEESTHMALKESMWSFGCVRVMYDATPVENPATAAPPMKEKEDTKVSPTEKQPRKRYGDILGLFQDVPPIVGERFYVKRIPARQVLFSADQSAAIEECSWVGYWWICFLEDVKRSPIYSNTSDLKSSGVRTGDDGDETRGEESDGYAGSDKVKLYYLWDQRTKTHLVLAEGHEKFLLQTKYKRNPLKMLRFDLDPDSAYPLPPIYHQLQPQDEFNDSREWLRLNRKGTVPRFTYDRDAITAEDMRKLESGQMGTYVPRDAGTHAVIEPVPQPNYSMVAMQTLALSKEEFTELSMVAAEARGVPESQTATQAKIIETRSLTKEAYERMIVSTWLAEIVEEMILLAIEKMSLSMWIRINADQHASGFPQVAADIAAAYKEITAADLEEAAESIVWSVAIEPESMSPVAESQEKQEWLQALSLLGNPIMTRLLATSPDLRKKTLSLFGVKSARDQELIGQALQVLMQLEMSMQAVGAKPSPGMASQPAVGPQPGSPPGQSSPAARQTPLEVATGPRNGGIAPPNPPVLQ